MGQVIVPSPFTPLCLILIANSLSASAYSSYIARPSEPPLPAPPVARLPYDMDTPTKTPAAVFDAVDAAQARVKLQKDHLQAQLNRVREEALQNAQESRPKGTRKTYKPIQNEFQVRRCPVPGPRSGGVNIRGSADAYVL